MKNKILIELIVPDVEETYNVYIPINKKVGNVIILLSKAIAESTNGRYKENEYNALYDGELGERYLMDTLIRNTNIRNGKKIILM